MKAVLAGLIFGLALVGVITRPRRLNEALWAAVGAAAMVVATVVRPEEAVAVLAGEWNIFLFFFGMMLIAAVADLAGFFDWAGALAAAASRGSARRLLLSTFIVGALITTFLSNDATAIILTPVVYAIVTRLGLPVLPYLFATSFVANTASMTLPISNPINILVVERFHPSFADYELTLLPATAVALLVNVLAFFFVFRRPLRQRFRIDARAAVREAVTDPRFFRSTGAGLLGIAIAYLTGASAGWPLGLVAALGGVVLAANALLHRRFSLREAHTHFSVALFVFIGGLFVMVRGVEDAGLTGAIVKVISAFAVSPVAAAVFSALGTGIGVNVINNFPMMLVMLSGIQNASLGGLQHPFVFGALVGADLGPNLTPVGSLSTMLWLLLVRRRGVEVSPLAYLRLGALITPITLLCAALLVGLRFR
jgi:arsenical pump membrane protein